jgi:hypothetical protein
MADFNYWGGSLHTALVHAATMYDRKEETKRGYNRYALGQYLMRIDEVEADIKAGTPPRAALLAAFNDRLLDHMLKAIGEPEFTRDEMTGQSYVYIPSSAA